MILKFSEDLNLKSQLRSQFIKKVSISYDIEIFLPIIYGPWGDFRTIQDSSIREY